MPENGVLVRVQSRPRAFDLGDRCELRWRVELLHLFARERGRGFGMRMRVIVIVIVRHRQDAETRGQRQVELVVAGLDLVGEDVSHTPGPRQHPGYGEERRAMSGTRGPCERHVPRLHFKYAFTTPTNSTAASVCA